jgi:hypothetical protein
MWRLQDDSDIAGWVMSDLLTRIEQYLHDYRYTSTTGLIEDCKAEIERLQADVAVLRGALGYECPAKYDGRLSDGTLPVNGIAAAMQEQVASLQAVLDAARAFVASNSAFGTADDADEMTRLHIETLAKYERMESLIRALDGEVKP